MLNSRTIKQSIIKSQQKVQQKPISYQIHSACSSIKQKQHIMPDFIPEAYTEEQDLDFYEEIIGNDFDQSRSMFTIRQQQSYQYESEQSMCIKRGICQSYIDHLSSIKAQLRTQHDTNKAVSIFEADKIQQTTTTTSTLNYNRMASEEVLSERVGCWESKISMKASGIQQFLEEVQEQDLVGPKQSQKALNLQITRMRNMGKNRQIKVLKNVDVAYSCSDQDFVEILKILEREGIRIFEREGLQNKKNSDNKQNRENMGKVQKNESKHSLKKIKLKVMKKQLQSIEKLM